MLEMGGTPPLADTLGRWHEFCMLLGTALAVSMGVLLVVGIHNPWDITVWTITRRRE